MINKNYKIILLNSIESNKSNELKEKLSSETSKGKTKPKISGLSVSELNQEIMKTKAIIEQTNKEQMAVNETINEKLAKKINLQKDLLMPITVNTEPVVVSEETYRTDLIELRSKINNLQYEEKRYLFIIYTIQLLNII